MFNSRKFDILIMAQPFQWNAMFKVELCVLGTTGDDSFMNTHFCPFCNCKNWYHQTSLWQYYSLKCSSPPISGPRNTPWQDYYKNR